MLVKSAFIWKQIGIMEDTFKKFRIKLYNLFCGMQVVLPEGSKEPSVQVPFSVQQFQEVIVCLRKVISNFVSRTVRDVNSHFLFLPGKIQLP